jgi:hypothetical protein
VNDARFSSDATHRVAQFMPEMWEIATAHVTPFDPCARLPEAFARVERRGIGWEALQVHPLGRPIGEELLDEMTAMNGGAIPHDHPAAGHLTQQVLQAGDHIRRGDGAVLTVDVHLPRRGDGRDGGQRVAGVPLPQDGGLADGGVGTHDTGQGIQPGLISEEDGWLLGFRPLFRAGQRSLRQ